MHSLMNKSNLIVTLKWVTGISVALFAGSDLTVSTLVHQIMTKQKTSVRSIQLWHDVYTYITPYHGILSSITGVCGFALWNMNQGINWGILGIISGSILTYSFALVAPLADKKLFELNEKENKEDKTPMVSHNAEIDYAIERWGWLSKIRSLAGITSLIFLLKEFLMD